MRMIHKLINNYRNQWYCPTRTKIGRWIVCGESGDTYQLAKDKTITESLAVCEPTGLEYIPE